jgi:hypothetical protein
MAVRPPKRPRDTNQLAWQIVREATGQTPKQSPVELPEPHPITRIATLGGQARAECIGCKKVAVTGDPNPVHISTSFVERSNLTMRMQMRRFTRLTNAFSKKVEMHAAAVALHFMHYNFCQIHGTLRVTPAMAAGIAKNVWSVEDVIALLV